MMTPIKLLLTLFLLLPALSDALPLEFTATYTAETYGMTVAETTYKLEHKNDGLTFTQFSATTGLAALFSKNEVSETSYLSLHQNQLLLDEYRYIQKGSKNNRDIHLKIKWNASTNNELTGTISGNASGKTIQLETDTPVWDTLSFQIPMMAGDTQMTMPQEYKVLVKGELKTYLFISHGPEEIDISNNLIKTIKIERKSDDGKKSLFLWIASSLHNLPVKIEKWKKGKPHITMLLKSAFFPSDKSLQFEIEDNFDDL